MRKSDGLWQTSSRLSSDATCRMILAGATPKPLFFNAVIRQLL